MDVILKKLTPKLCEDYLYFFDKIAFTDHEEFSACYCLESHISKQEDKELDTKSARREKVKELIESGIMEGYLLYEERNVIGWCNAGDKESYLAFADGEHDTVDTKSNKVKAIYCIDIAPAYRGKGIAHLVLDKVCLDAVHEGYDYVEGYPFLDKEFKYQFHGPIHLYETHGFTRVADKSYFCIMSKKL